MATPKLFSIALLAASALAFSAPAMADWKSKDVKYDDLDLSTAAGQDELKSRVKIAVKQICGSPRSMILNERFDEKKCREAAMTNAMSKVEQTVATYLDTRRLASRQTKAIVGN